ncbi:MAG: hypothetical protein GY952_10215 [Rhodobacteraceae bacterium]|nr:hypothetical protein [Paracoccaceae bacterium]
MIPHPTRENIQQGAKNLLLNCAHARSGEKILIVGEVAENTYFEPKLCKDVADAAELLGMKPEILMVAPGSDADHFPASVTEGMQRSDRTIFLSRLGDQVRFSNEQAKKRTVMSYTVTRKHLAAPFGTADFDTLGKVHDLLVDLIRNSQSYRITADCGTDLSCRINPDASKAITEFAVELFPVMIFPPVHFHQTNGIFVISHFTTSTSTRAYEGSVVIVDEAVRVTVKNARMVGFDGPEALVSRLKTQFETAAALTGGDPYLLNSWHTGINPNTFFEGDPLDDLEYWGVISYGSPRYTHLHACGHNPGDVAFHLMDATISFDGTPLWDRGRFVFLDRPEVKAVIGKDQKEFFNSALAHSIGL